jgi:two-component system KDP operon response regulator KdpE
MSLPILLVEDDPDLSQAIRAGLEASGYAVIESSTLRTARAALDRAQFSCALVDLGLPDGNGLSLIRQLRDHAATPCIVISARGLETQKIEALDVGADDYLVKPFGIGELQARIRVLLRRQSALERTYYQLGDVEVDVDRRIVRKAGEAIHLSPIEFDLLLALLRADGRLVSHRKLLQTIWGPEAIDQTQYLRVYMGKLRAKLERNPAMPELILTELGVGYRAKL